MQIEKVGVNKDVGKAIYVVPLSQEIYLYPLCNSSYHFYIVNIFIFVSNNIINASHRFEIGSYHRSNTQ